MMLAATSGFADSPTLARDIEADYAAFCRATRPMTVVLICWVGMIALQVIIHHIQDHYPNFLTGYGWWLDQGAHTIEVGFTAPAIIAALRGRRYLQSIFFGRLSARWLILVGVAVGCGTMLLSMVAYSHLSAPCFTFAG